jgi:hypothetical protein
MTTVTNCGNRSIYRNGIAEGERERDRPSGKAVEKQYGVDQVRAAEKRAPRDQGRMTRDRVWRLRGWGERKTLASRAEGGVGVGWGGWVGGWFIF